MKNLLCFLFMTFGVACSVSANSNPKASKTKTSETKNKSAVTSKKTALVEQRANNLSDQMIRELRLNNYQASKVRAINMDVAAQITEIEQRFTGDQNMIDNECKAILATRDQELEDVLSTIQYNDYFGHRKVYSKKDKEFVASLSEQGAEKVATSAGEAVQGATAGNASAEAATSTVN
ncbi:hypothetical protein OB13_01765 [Pontibacter sp. HJ8]